MCSSVSADDEMTFTESDQAVMINTGNAVAAVYKSFPAAMIIPSDGDDSVGYGIVMSSALAYNATADGSLVLEDVPYHASFEHATWSVSAVSHGLSDEMGETMSVSLSSSLSINKRLAFGGNDLPSGTPGIDIIENWATVTVTFVVSTNDYSSHYEEVPDSPEYAVNGRTELKFDISIELKEDIDATNVALDIGLMMMESYNFSSTSMPEQYVFRGYQEEVVSESDPSENETDGDLRLLHEFMPRDDFKQLFTYVKDSEEVGFFGWAREAEFGRTDNDDGLDEIDTLYRTDGESLRVYLSTALDNTTTRILHDPSVGLFPGAGGGTVDTPDGLVVGISSESAIIGAVIGITAVGVATTYFVVHRKNGDDQVDTVKLEKNRYYRKRQ